MTADTKPTLDHPVVKIVKERFPEKRFRGTEYRGQSTLIVDAADSHEVLAFLRDDAACRYNFLSDVFGIDYLNYPSRTIGRFAVVYNLLSHERDDRLFVSLSRPVTPDRWHGRGSGAGGGQRRGPVARRRVARARGVRHVRHPLPQSPRPAPHPDVEAFPAHPLRKDYLLRGRGEREQYRIVDRTSA